MNEKELILEIMNKVLSVNSLQKNTVFYDYSGHINAISIRIYNKGWKEGKNPDYSKTIYLKDQFIENSNKELLEVLNKLKELSKTDQSQDSSND